MTELVTFCIFSQDSYGHENSLNLKMHFPGVKKSWVLGKMAKSWKNHGNSFRVV